MFNNLPLHALIVHMPIALTVLVPLFAVLALVLGRRIMTPTLAWSFPVGLLALLLVSGLIAEQTGEQQEDKVERFVPEAAFEKHEEAAELFLFITGGVLVLSAGGLLRNRVGATMRLVGTAGTLVVFGAGWNVGHSGGALVYEHNAGAAYSQSTTVAEPER
jgi:prepilin signal peptidase PulO-like enzyme (type II secretory pathway)